MGSSLTKYCLQELTDYLEFERLCNDLMSLEGYPSIEPLGGFSDKGRDAIHIGIGDKTTIFAYSVREDWRAKLSEDANKIKKHDHKCDNLVFITTSDFSSGERDEAINTIKNDYGWKLDLYGCERLRMLLDVKHPQIKNIHPQIFPPEFLQAQENIQQVSYGEYLFISSVIEDSPFSDWLIRKLTAAGYAVWHERLNLLGGEIYPNDVDEVIKNKTFRMIALYSNNSLQNLEVMRQRTLALSIGREQKANFVIPINVDGIDFNQLDNVTKLLNFIPFESNWAFGLQQLLKKLESINCPQPLADGRSSAVEMVPENDVISLEAEPLYSNCLQIETIPRNIVFFKANQEIPRDAWSKLRHQWAFRKTGNLFLSFQFPPEEIANQLEINQVGTAPWTRMTQIEGINSKNLVSELLKKSLYVKSHEKGLKFCNESKLDYFPSGLFDGERLYFTRPDNSRTFVKVAGQRKYITGEYYQYNLAPTFYIDQNLFGDFTLLIGTRIRLTDVNGVVLASRTAISRRKHLCKYWWNREWFNRFLAICEFLSADGEITIGHHTNQKIAIKATPMQVVAPIGINEDEIENLAYYRNEYLTSISDGGLDDSNLEGLDNA